jgi:hypothetical protein
VAQANHYEIRAQSENRFANRGRYLPTRQLDINIYDLSFAL